MPIPNYAVLKGKAIDKFRGEPNDSTPHYEIHVTAAGKHYRIAVNVQSQQAPSEVLYFVNEDFEWAHLQELKGLAGGFTGLDDRDNIAIDYVRSQLFDTSTMKPLPANDPGASNDLERLIDKYITLAITKPGAMLYAFGSRFGPENKKDATFGFTPGLGVHDIHMNQGNSGKQFVKDDGVFQDGALLINLPQGDQWIAIFLAFQSQSFQTDDRTGHRLAAAAAAATGHGNVVVQPPARHPRKRRRH
jgi:uncharacterized protein YukJ